MSYIKDELSGETQVAEDEPHAREIKKHNILNSWEIEKWGEASAVWIETVGIFRRIRV